MCSLHDPLPRLVDVLEPFGLLDQIETNGKFSLSYMLKDSEGHVT